MNDLVAPPIQEPSATSPPRGRPAGRTPDASPIDRLLDEPQRFEFHQAVRLLHAHLRRLPGQERPAIRFRNTLSLAFPASEIASIDRHPPQRRPIGSKAEEPVEPQKTLATADGAIASATLERIELTPAFMGLLGAAGALPLAYSEQFAQREAADRDGAARAFLDIFQHRAITLFHEAWRKHRLPLQFESDRHDRYLPLALSLAGLGEPALRERLRGADGGVADDALAFYSGLLQRRAVSAGHLQQVLSDYFGVPVHVAQFIGCWHELGDDCQLVLGSSTASLGDRTVLGPRVWQRDLRVRVSIGPMERGQHQRFLPGGSAALALRELLALVSGTRLEYEVRLRLRAADVVGAMLPGAAQAEGAGPRLGWDSFLISRPSTEDREEAAYILHALVA